MGQIVSAGRYQNASEVVREGLRLLERREHEDAAKPERLRAAVAIGEAALESGDYDNVSNEQLAGWLGELRYRRSAADG